VAVLGNIKSHGIGQECYYLVILGVIVLGNTKRFSTEQTMRHSTSHTNSHIIGEYNDS